MQGASPPAIVTEERQAPAESDLSLPSAVKGILTSSVSHVRDKLHRNRYEVTRVSRVICCPLQWVWPPICYSGANRGVWWPRRRWGLGQRRGHPWIARASRLPETRGVPGDNVSSQVALIQSGKEVAGAVGGKLTAPAGLAEGLLLEQDAAAPSKGAQATRH